MYYQKQINDNIISKKFLANDKILESMATQLEGFNSVTKNQLSFNKMIETQVPQLASSCPNTNLRKLPESPESPTVPFAGGGINGAIPESPTIPVYLKQVMDSKRLCIYYTFRWEFLLHI